jgi:hypothetical protein
MKVTGVHRGRNGEPKRTTENSSNRMFEESVPEQLSTSDEYPKYYGGTEIESCPLNTLIFVKAFTFAFALSMPRDGLLI